MLKISTFITVCCSNRFTRFNSQQLCNITWRQDFVCLNSQLIIFWLISFPFLVFPVLSVGGDGVDVTVLPDHTTYLHVDLVHPSPLHPHLTSPKITCFTLPNIYQSYHEWTNFVANLKDIFRDISTNDNDNWVRNASWIFLQTKYKCIFKINDMDCLTIYNL